MYKLLLLSMYSDVYIKNSSFIFLYDCEALICFPFVQNTLVFFQMLDFIDRDTLLKSSSNKKKI